MSNTVGFSSKWYRKWFGEEYLRVYAHRDLNDAIQLINLIRRQLPLHKKDCILDVACGTARHARILSRMGYTVLGIDLSVILLRLARQKKTHERYPFLIRSDMRHLPFKPRFDVVLSLFTSYGYFAEDKQNEQVITEFAAVLKKQGRLIIDFLNPGYVQKHLKPTSEHQHLHVHILEERWIEGGRVYKKITIDHEKVFIESVRLYQLDDMAQMLADNGFQVEQVFGDYQASTFSVESERMIILAKKNR
jgi:SAM-dependent methyltransferase